MARRKSSSKKEVSLFPFLDILGCLIGSLILIITTVVLEQMDSQPVAQAAKIDDTRQEASRALARLAALEKQLALIERKADAGDVRLAAARRRADAAARRAAEARKKLAAAEQIKVDAPAAPKPVDTTALAARKKKLEDDAAKVRAEIAERKKPIEQSIVVLPPGTGGGGPKRGVFVEAAKGKVVVHDAKKPWEAAADKAVADPRFKELLARTAADKDAVITILVRPDGLSTLGLLQKAAAEAGARVGRVPLPGSGSLDLTGAR
jgi:multidrug efflux pump subunit AcrA (membrane-fusion protein)